MGLLAILLTLAVLIAAALAMAISGKSDRPRMPSGLALSVRGSDALVVKHDGVFPVERIPQVRVEPGTEVPNFILVTQINGTGHPTTATPLVLNLDADKPGQLQGAMEAFRLDGDTTALRIRWSWQFAESHIIPVECLEKPVRVDTRGHGPGIQPVTAALA